MELPEKEWYTIQEVATRWGCSEADVLHYIQTNKIRPSFMLCEAESEIKNPVARIMEGCESKIGKFSGLASPLDYDWHYGNGLMTSDWKCDLMSVTLTHGEPISIDENTAEDFFKYVYWITPISQYVIYITDILITNTEAVRFESLCQDQSHAHQKVVLESQNNLSDSTDGKIATQETDLELYTRLKQAGLTNENIVIELKKQFPSICNHRIGKLIADPNKHLSSDGYRKIGQRMSQKIKGIILNKSDAS